MENNIKEYCSAESLEVIKKLNLDNLEGKDLEFKKNNLYLDTTVLNEIEKTIGSPQKEEEKIQNIRELPAKIKYLNILGKALVLGRVGKLVILFLMMGIGIVFLALMTYFNIKETRPEMIESIFSIIVFLITIMTILYKEVYEKVMSSYVAVIKNEMSTSIFHLSTAMTSLHALQEIKNYLTMKSLKEKTDAPTKKDFDYLLISELKEFDMLFKNKQYIIDIMRNIISSSIAHNKEKHKMYKTVGMFAILVLFVNALFLKDSSGINIGYFFIQYSHLNLFLVFILTVNYSYKFSTLNKEHKTMMNHGKEALEALGVQDLDEFMENGFDRDLNLILNITLDSKKD